LAGAAMAAGAGGATPVHAARVAHPPTIDGALAPGEWDASAVFDGWTQQLPAEGAAPSERSELRVLYDDRALYLAFRFRDRSPAGAGRWRSPSPSRRFASRRAASATGGSRRAG